MKTTNVCRVANPIFDIQALCYNFYEFDVLPTDFCFDFRAVRVREMYNNYRAVNYPDIPEWRHDMFLELKEHDD